MCANLVLEQRTGGKPARAGVAHLHEHLVGEAHEAEVPVEAQVLQQHLLPLPALV